LVGSVSHRMVSQAPKVLEQVMGRSTNPTVKEDKKAAQDTLNISKQGNQTNEDLLKLTMPMRSS
jgi:hypothetical protein